MNNNNIPVIYYHSIAPFKNKDWPKKYLTLNLHFFENHLKFFKKNGFQALFLDEYFDLLQAESKNKKYFVLTFDDGYLDNYIYVYPLLKKYAFKATIFINPEFVPKDNQNNGTLFDYWENKKTLADIDKWGFLNWDEMSEMEESGIIDIQSHTMSHTKYFISDKIIDFHHKNSDCLYYIGNLYPARKPNYITDPKFEKLLPCGYPVFEQASSVIAKAVQINNNFRNEIIDILNNKIIKSGYDFKEIYNLIKPIYNKFKKENSIILSTESNDDFMKRLVWELKESKKIIEQKLNKKVNYLCWPHGDNSELAHQTALKVGYKATSLGKMSKKYFDTTRFDRFGLASVRNNLFLTNLKTKYKVGSFRNEEPYKVIKNIYEFIRDSF